MSDKHERFCDRLKVAMGDQSSRSLAIKSEMSPTVVAKYINGESTPNVERLVALADALGVTVEWLATGREPVTYSSKDESGISKFVPEPAGAYNKALKPTEEHEGILTDKASRIIDFAVESGLFAFEWGAHANFFIALYNDVASKGFTEHAIKKAVLLTQVKNYELTIMTLEIRIEQGDSDSEGLQDHIDKMKRAISEAREKLKELNVDTSRVGIFDF